MKHIYYFYNYNSASAGDPQKREGFIPMYYELESTDSIKSELIL